MFSVIINFMNKKCIKDLIPLAVLLLLVVVCGIRSKLDANGSGPQSQIETPSDAEHQAKVDAKTAKAYQPTPEMKILTKKIGLTEKGRVIFYASKPQLLDAAAFNSKVPDNYDSNAILGYCDHRKIYLYRINNQDLAGIVEVTMAHEALHADWERLTKRERRELIPLLEEDYAKIKTDKTEIMLADYAKFEIGQRDNELHSFLGTEYHHLSPKLEKHYAKYFKDRDKIVGMYEHYQTKIDSIAQQSTQLTAEVAALKAQIDNELPQYETDISNLNAEIDAFNQQSQADADAEAARERLQEKVAELVNRQTQLDGLVAQYNAKTVELDQIALKASEFNKSINSKAIDPNQSTKVTSWGGISISNQDSGLVFWVEKIPSQATWDGDYDAVLVRLTHMNAVTED